MLHKKEAGCHFSMLFRAPIWGQRCSEHHQHREEREEAADAQSAPGGDTDARQQKAKRETQHPIYF
jgi:hypothetical protein